MVLVKFVFFPSLLEQPLDQRVLLTVLPTFVFPDQLCISYQVILLAACLIFTVPELESTSSIEPDVCIIAQPFC